MPRQIFEVAKFVAYALTFLTVALEEGKPVGTFAREMNVNRWVMTRIMQTIGDKPRNGAPGLSLVTIERTAGYATRTEVFLPIKAARSQTKCSGN